MSRLDKAKNEAAKPRAAQAQRLVRPDFVRREWCFTMPAGIAQADLLAPDYWRTVSHQLARGDLIEVRDDFLTRYARLWVIGVDRPTGNVEVRLLVWHEVEAAAPTSAERLGFTPRDAGVHEGWMVVRDADGQVMKRNIASFHEAMRIIKIELAPETVR